MDRTERIPIEGRGTGPNKCLLKEVRWWDGLRHKEVGRRYLGTCLLAGIRLLLVHWGPSESHASLNISRVLTSVTRLIILGGLGTDFLPASRLQGPPEEASSCLQGHQFRGVACVECGTLE